MNLLSFYDFIVSSPSSLSLWPIPEGYEFNHESEILLNKRPSFIGQYFSFLGSRETRHAEESVNLVSFMWFPDILLWTQFSGMGYLDPFLIS